MNASDVVKMMQRSLMDAEVTRLEIEARCEQLEHDLRAVLPLAEAWASASGSEDDRMVVFQARMTVAAPSLEVTP